MLIVVNQGSDDGGKHFQVRQPMLKNHATAPVRVVSDTHHTTLCQSVVSHQSVSVRVTFHTCLCLSVASTMSTCVSLWHHTSLCQSETLHQSVSVSGIIMVCASCKVR